MFAMPGRRWRRSPPARAVAGYATTRTAMVAAGLLLVGLVAACAPPATGPQPPHAAVLEVIDGDTVVVRTGQTTEHVRLLGIDTPEIAHHGQPGDCFGAEAATRTAELLPAGTTVRLARDVEARDMYDRLLAYVLTPDGNMVNLQLAAEGYARELTITPNTRVADHVAAAVDRARDSSIGLWAQCPAEDT